MPVVGSRCLGLDGAGWPVPASASLEGRDETGAPLNSYVARVTCFQPNVLPVIGLLCNHMQSKAELETNGFSK